MNKNFTISGYSTALFSTWWFIQEYGILFDCGDGVVSHLLQKSRKIKHIFISHPDRDHLMGIFQVLQLNAREGGFPKIYYPKHSGSFKAMESFTKQFDKQVELTEWIPMEAGQEVEVQNGLFVQAIGNRHFPVIDGKVKCFSFHLIEKRKKLKPEFQTLSSQEIIDLKNLHGPNYITSLVPDTILSYSADTQVEWDGRWDNTHTLIHEATFLEQPDGKIIQERFNKHSVLDDVIKMVSQTKVQCLILGHISTRYYPDQIDEAIRTSCKTHGLDIPVYRILPGEFLWDVIDAGMVELENTKKEI